MSKEKEHLDLLAYVEDRLDQSEQKKAQAHLDQCKSCREEVIALQQAIGVVDSVKAKVRSAFTNRDQLGREAEACLGPDTSNDESLELSPGDVISELPSVLANRLPQENKQSITDRLMKSIQTFTGKGKEAAQTMAERIMTGGMEPGAAPAIREDATKEEGEVKPAESDVEPGNHKRDD